MGKKIYQQRVDSELNEFGAIKYGRIDVIIEQNRERCEIMRSGCKKGRGTKASEKYRSGLPMSDDETESVFNNGLRKIRLQVIRTAVIGGATNDKGLQSLVNVRR